MNVSREGDSTISMGSLCQCSVTFSVKNVSCCSEETFYVSVCAHHLGTFCHHVPLSAPLTKPALCTPYTSLHVFIHDKMPLSLLQDEQCHLSWPFFTGRMLQFPLISLNNSSPFAGLCSICSSLSFAEGPRTGPSAPSVASPVLSREDLLRIVCLM